MSSGLSTYSFFVPFYGEDPGETHFSPLIFIEASFLSKNVCLHVRNGRRSDHGSCILNFYAPDLNLEHPILPAELIYFLITLCSRIITRTILVHILS